MVLLLGPGSAYEVSSVERERIEGIRDGYRSRVTMASTIQLPVFKGAGGKDPEQFWFLLTSVWNGQQIVDDNITKATLVSAL